jgi:uncharacterized membrane protein
MKIPLDTKDKISEVISILFLVASFLIVALSIPDLPDIVPNHFNLKGEPNKYGSKHYLWVMVGISVFLYIGLTVLAKFPQIYNFRYTPNNIEEQYKLTSKMVRNLKLGLMFFQAALTFFMVQSAQLKFVQYVFFLIPLVLIIVFGNVIYYTIQWGKIK